MRKKSKKNSHKTVTLCSLSGASLLASVCFYTEDSTHVTFNMFILAQGFQVPSVLPVKEVL